MQSQPMKTDENVLICHQLKIVWKGNFSFVWCSIFMLDLRSISIHVIYAFLNIDLILMTKLRWLPVQLGKRMFFGGRLSSTDSVCDNIDGNRMFFDGICSLLIFLCFGLFRVAVGRSVAPPSYIDEPRSLSF